MKGDILNEIRSSDNELNQKDVRIVQLEKELAKNTFDNKKLLKGANILFPSITALSVSSQSLVNSRDSIISRVTAVIYSTPREIPEGDKDKLRSWLNERLSVTNVELYRNNTT